MTKGWDDQGDVKAASTSKGLLYGWECPLGHTSGNVTARLI